MLSDPHNSPEGPYVGATCRDRSTMRFIRELLALPETRGLDLDDPRLTELRRRVIRDKPFLRRVYSKFYSELMAELPGIPKGTILEVGSGAGFLKEINADVVTSEIMQVSGVDSVLSALELPFKDKTLSAILMVNVLHHLPKPAQFLKEASRVLLPGGRIAMIEPWNSPFGRMIYRNFHHEPFDPQAGWELKGQGPLSDANGAVPWIVFVRDRERFASEFPALKLTRLKPIMPFNYLLSGGASMRALVPGASYPLFAAIDKLTSPIHRLLGMFAVITLEGTPHQNTPSD